MNEAEISRTMRRVMELWPRWDRTQAQLEVWMKTLRDLDANRIGNAIDAYYTASKYNTPRLSEICQRYREISDTAEVGQQVADGQGRINWYVICVAAPESTPGLLGWSTTLCYGFDKYIPREPGRIRRDMEDLRRRWQEQWGGDWQIVQDATWFEMLQRRQVLQRQAMNNLPRKEYLKRFDVVTRTEERQAVAVAALTGKGDK